MKRLSTILALAVFFSGALSAAEPQPKPEKIMVKTLYEGTIPYVLDPSGCYVRSGGEAEKWIEHDREFSVKEL